jgi:hypothetical protein
MNERRKALAAIEKHGVLLVFPIQNRKEPLALWHVLHPRSEMRWEWDDNGDDRVAELWHLREQLSKSGKVVYAKWYQNRATFFSKKAFVHMLSPLLSLQGYERGVTADANRILRTLEETSPLSTKQLKAATELQGKLLEGVFQRAVKSLWDRLRIVGYGEIDDGAFPSLAYGATKLLHEDVWRDAEKAQVSVDSQFFGNMQRKSPLIHKHYFRIHRSLVDLHASRADHALTPSS